MKAFVTVLIALGAGLGLAWMDSRPQWDDTGVTAGLVMIISAGLSLMCPPKWAVVSLLVALPIVIVALSQNGNWGSALAVLLSLVAGAAGAWAGGRSSPRSWPV